MNQRSDPLNPAVDPNRDHILGLANAELTLVQYGSYADFRCRAVHAVVEGQPPMAIERLTFEDVEQVRMVTAMQPVPSRR